MQAEYDRLRDQVKHDPGTAGANGEKNWKKLLEEWLPPNYRVVTGGTIMNTKGECGPQTDILVLSPWYPKSLAEKSDYYLEAGVVAAFECKLTLRPDGITQAVNNAETIS